MRTVIYSVFTINFNCFHWNVYIKGTSKNPKIERERESAHHLFLPQKMVLSVFRFNIYSILQI